MVTLGGTVYVTGDVTMTRTQLEGFGDIVAEGSITINITEFGLTITEFLPLLMSVNSDVTVDGSQAYSPYIESIIYAPEGRIYLKMMNAYGSVAASNILLERSSLDYPAELRGRADLPGTGLDTVTYQFK